MYDRHPFPGWIRMMRQWPLLWASLFLLLIPGRIRAQKWSGIIDSSRATDWSNVGITAAIPNRTTICATLNPGASSAQINSAIANCPANQVVFLNAGTYTLAAGINFNGHSNVTLRGAGPTQTIVQFTGGDSCGGNGGDVCLISSPFYWSGDSAVLPGGSSACSWTGGYSQGTTQITLSSCGGTPPVGQFIILDQANDSSDTGGVYICTTNCNVSGSNDINGRVINSVLHSQQQVVMVTAVSGSGSGPYTVTISPGLYANNWRSSQAPGAWWPGMVTLDGIENMTLDHSSTGASYKAGVYFFDCYQCWVKNIRSIKSVRNHVWFYQSARGVVRDSYFYDTQREAEESYGTEMVMTSDNLVENNIWQKIASPLYADSTEGTVFAYNYTDQNLFLPTHIAITNVSLLSNLAVITGTLSDGSTPITGQALYISGTTTGGGQFNVQGAPVTAVTGFGSVGASGTVSFVLTGSTLSATADSGVVTVNSQWQQVSYAEHGTGNQMNLFEGNSVNGLSADNYWGTGAVSTYFRNYSRGWQNGTNENTLAMQVYAYNRGYNVIGNVLGTSGYHTQYESSGSVGSRTSCWTSVFGLGWPASGTSCLQLTNDPLVRSTLLRWGNYDTVNASVQWNQSEIPTSGAAFINGNAVPANHNLPPSFYLSTKPGWWGPVPWPAIGPDVTGGNISGVAGFVYSIPAQTCYSQTPRDINGLLLFNADSCYQQSLPAPPTGLSLIVK
jgi:hypothetical protein